MEYPCEVLVLVLVLKLNHCSSGGRKAKYPREVVLSTGCSNLKRCSKVSLGHFVEPIQLLGANIEAMQSPNQLQQRRKTWDFDDDVQKFRKKELFVCMH